MHAQVSKLLYLTIGENKGAPRLFIESDRLRAAGLDVGARYTPVYDADAKRVNLIVSDEGDRIVCRRKRADGDVPLIDINNQQLGMFGTGARVVVAIRADGIEIELHHHTQREVERVERLLQELAAGQVSTGEVCAGGGVMAEALHVGLARAGVSSKMRFAVEMEPDYVGSLNKRCAAVTADTLLVQGSMQEIDLSRLPKVSVLASGIPCTGASLSGRAKNKLSRPEDHATAGHLFVHFLRIVEAVNPTVCLLENVPSYANTVSFAVITSCLREWGYTVEHRVLDRSLGAFEDRQRLVMVATTKGVDVRFEDLVPAATAPKTLGELLEDIPADDPRFKRYDYLKAKEVRDIEAGKGFRQQIVGPDATSCGTIGRGYAKVRSTEIRVACPGDPNKSRLLTPAEHARVKGAPERLVAGLCDTTAHEILGQGVLFPMFVAVGRMIGNGIQRLRSAPKILPPQLPPVDLSPRAALGQLSLFAA
ncbi:DNA cytosine methyltransferase [Sinimarinibacterium sp. CAU 1509]|uniref:DNA cytosine methyltransferase n=1 Tax=Sinimarinibacterium sp. CAU 1509 TaxID=2562283 RepID=UPI00146B71CB|nr:DNA cytosine methyltransferase [Sinimarinibacterium sp. CAU 1509]